MPLSPSAPHPRQPRQHPTTQFFTGRMPFLPPNQQHQSTNASLILNPNPNSNASSAAGEDGAATVVFLRIVVKPKKLPPYLIRANPNPNRLTLLGFSPFLEWPDFHVCELQKTMLEAKTKFWCGNVMISASCLLGPGAKMGLWVGYTRSKNH